jgi:hypothetical protein
MRFVHHPTPFWTFLAATCLIVETACTTLRSVAPDELRGPNPPDRVRITETNDSTMVLRSPQLVGDTLRGFVDSTRRAFPLSQTTEIDAWADDPGGTAAAVVFGGAVGALTYLVLHATKSSPQNCCPPGVPCVEGVPPCP